MVARGIWIAACLVAGTARAGWRYSEPYGAQSAPQTVHETVHVPPVARTAPVAGETPRRGITRKRVLGDFGEPELRLDPVGQPPIGRWVYPAFIVYFERDRVITSVPR